MPAIPYHGQTQDHQASHCCSADVAVTTAGYARQLTPNQDIRGLHLHADAAYRGVSFAWPCMHPPLPPRTHAATGFHAVRVTIVTPCGTQFGHSHYQSD